MRRILFLSLLWLGYRAEAQFTYSLDDDQAFVAQLEKDTKDASNDSVKAYNCLKLSFYCKLLGDTVKAKAYLSQGIELGEKYPFIRGAGYYYLSHAQYGKIDIPLRERHLVTADSLLRGMDGIEPARVLTMVWHNYGILQQMRGNEKAAMEVFTKKAAGYARRCGDAASLGKLSKAIGIIYMNANDRNKAAEYLQQAAGFYEQPSSDNPTRLEELVDTYITAAENYGFMDKPDSAKPLLDKSKAILAPHPSSNIYLRYYFALGTYYNKVKQYDQAIASFDKGIGLRNEPIYQPAINRLKLGKYNTYRHQNDYRNAVEVLEELMQSPYLVETDRVKYYKELYDTYSLLGAKEKSLFWASKYIKLNDSLNEAGVQRTILELERKYNDAENKRQLVQLAAENDKVTYAAKSSRLLAWLLGLTCIFLLTLFIVGRMYYKKKQHLARQQEINFKQQLQDAERKQEVGVAKAMLEGEENERRRLAGDLHDGLGGMLSGVKMNLSRLVNSQRINGLNEDLYKVIDQLDLSVNELRRIARNMMPESLLQLGLEESLKDLCFELKTRETAIEFQALNLSGKIPDDVRLSIYRIVQELIANAVKHAKASEVFVQCSQDENSFFITVEDNGQGFDAKQIEKAKGIGLSNVKRRVEYLGGSLEIISEIGKGTEINIEFNILKREGNEDSNS